jgi:hypothetical protein
METEKQEVALPENDLVLPRLWNNFALVENPLS